MWIHSPGVKESLTQCRYVGQEGCRMSGMQESWDAGQVVCRTGGIKDRWDAGQEGNRTGGVQ